MMDRVDLSRGIFTPSAASGRPAVGLDDRRSLAPRLVFRWLVAEKYLAPDFLSVRRTVQSRALYNVFRLLCPGNPADGLAKHKCDVVPPPAILQRGAASPGTPRL